MQRDIRILLIALIVLVLDQLLKVYVVELLDLRNRMAIDVIDPYLNLRMAWNRGINFGIGASGHDLMRYGLISLAIIVSVGLWIWGRRFSGWAAPLYLGLIIGGALGNAIDRLRYGAVADFLNMSCCGINNPYAFNIADIAIFIGAIGIAIFSDRLPKHG